MYYTLRSFEKGSGFPVVLLHGLISSHHYWDRTFEMLADTHRVIALDLLGFGRSPKPRSCSYSLDDHIDSIYATLKQLRVKDPVILVGYSMGANIATAFAVKYPDFVCKLVLITPPIFKNDEEALIGLSNYSSYFRMMKRMPWLGVSVSNLNYYLRPFSRRIAPSFIKHLPRNIAAETVMHTGRSFQKTTDNVLIKQRTFAELKNLKIPVSVLYGVNDPLVEVPTLHELATVNRNITCTEISAGHQIPLDTPQSVIDAIQG
jgi:pimeloyl-ACP methyl ester carboxylesterase